jgi:hypothetical protein
MRKAAPSQKPYTFLDKIVRAILTWNSSGRILMDAPIVRPPAERPQMQSRSGLVYPSCKQIQDCAIPRLLISYILESPLACWSAQKLSKGSPRNALDEVVLVGSTLSLCHVFGHWDFH